MRAAVAAFAYTKTPMTGRSPANKPWWWLACLLAGCVHTGHEPRPAFGQNQKSVLEPRDVAPVAPVAPVAQGAESANREAPVSVAAEAAVVAAAVAETMVVDPVAIEAVAAPRSGRDERTLRNAFAKAEDPSQPALELAGFLVQQERHFEALYVIDAALKRRREAHVDADTTVPLRLARAGLLRDVARCDLAVTELRGIVRERTAKRVAPATLFDLAQVEWVSGDNRAAKTTLALLQREHSGDDWLRRHADELAAWHRRLEASNASRDPLANGDLRDVFALLRAAPELAARQRLLRSLARPRPGADGRASVRLRAIAIACADESPAMRALAVQLAASNELDELAFWQTALRDRAPLVRNYAAAGLARITKEVPSAVAILYAAIRQETDEHAFLSQHRSLGKLLEVAPDACDAATDDGRQAALGKWKELCEH